MQQTYYCYNVYCFPRYFLCIRIYCYGSINNQTTAENPIKKIFNLSTLINSGILYLPYFKILRFVALAHRIRKGILSHQYSWISSMYFLILISSFLNEYRRIRYTKYDITWLDYFLLKCYYKYQFLWTEYQFSW